MVHRGAVWRRRVFLRPEDDERTRWWVVTLDLDEHVENLIDGDVEVIRIQGFADVEGLYRPVYEFDLQLTDDFLRAAISWGPQKIRLQTHANGGVARHVFEVRYSIVRFVPAVVFLMDPPVVGKASVMVFDSDDTDRHGAPAGRFNYRTVIWGVSSDVQGVAVIGDRVARSSILAVYDGQGIAILQRRLVFIETVRWDLVE